MCLLLTRRYPCCRSCCITRARSDIQSLMQASTLRFNNGEPWCSRSNKMSKTMNIACMYTVCMCMPIHRDTLGLNAQMCTYIRMHDCAYMWEWLLLILVVFRCLYKQMLVWLRLFVCVHVSGQSRLCVQKRVSTIAVRVWMISRARVSVISLIY